MLVNVDWNCFRISYRAGLQNNTEANFTLRVMPAARIKEKLSDILHKFDAKSLTQLPLVGRGALRHINWEAKFP